MSAHAYFVSDPAIWRILDQRIGAADALLLGDQDHDAFRVSLTVVVGARGPEVEARVVYPCRVCGWRSACGAGGEDCLPLALERGT